MKSDQSADQEYACEDCGFTSPLTNDVCPSCSGRMTALNAPARAQEGGEADPEDEEAAGDFTDSNDGALSLERLQEEESRDDYQADDYGDGDE